MQKGSSSSAQRSAYLTALTQEIERKLQKASSSQSQRFDLLQQLFADIALEIDDRARDIILSRDEDGITAADDGIENKLCFYDILANYYVKVPENGKRIVDLIVQLWSQSFASHIFALLFHKWLFEVPLENSEAVLRYGSALVQGATNVFWIDIQTNTRRFLSLFRYLLEEVAIVPDHLNKISLQTRRDLFSLLSRFIFFYNLDHLLENFLKHFPVPTNAFLVGGPADLFVIELTDQLHKLKVEPVLLHYLSHMRALQGWELRMTTSTRLKVCLYSFTSPGGPMYPTRAVRHKAWETLDLLFPSLLQLSYLNFNNWEFCYNPALISPGWTSSPARYQPLLPTAISLVLALFLLEFHHHLHPSSILLNIEIDFFKLGEHDEIKKEFLIVVVFM